MEEHIPLEEYQQILNELNEKLSGNIYFQNRNTKLPFKNFGASLAGEQMYIFFVYAHFLSDSLLFKAKNAYGDLLKGSELSMSMYLLPDIITIFNNFRNHNYNIGESPLSESERVQLQKYKVDNMDDIVFFLPHGMSLMPENPLFMFVEELKEHNRSRIQEYKRVKLEEEKAKKAEEEHILQVEEEAKKAEASGQKPDKFLKYNLMKQYGVNKNNIVIAMRNAGESLEFIDEWKSTTEPPVETGWLKDGESLKKSRKLKKKSKNKSKQKKDEKKYKKSLKKKRKSQKKH